MSSIAKEIKKNEMEIKRSLKATKKFLKEKSFPSGSLIQTRHIKTLKAINKRLRKEQTRNEKRAVTENSKSLLIKDVRQIISDFL